MKIIQQGFFVFKMEHQDNIEYKLSHSFSNTINISKCYVASIKQQILTEQFHIKWRGKHIW